MTTNKNCIRPLFITIVVVFALLLLSTNASAGTISVNNTNMSCVYGVQPNPYSGEYCEIQDAINDSDSYDTINVATGTYNENLIIDKEITLQAGSNPIIDGAGGDCINITIDNVTIDGFEIRNGSNGTLIQPSVNNVTVKNNQLSYNTYGGVIVLGDGEGSGIHINCNDITDNEVYGVESERTYSDVNATQNWWGHTSGPYDPSNDTSTGGLYNPLGQGDNVSDCVDYDPWSFTPDPCEPKTIGFWKNHPDSVDAVLDKYGSIILGNTSGNYFEVDDSDNATAVFKNAKNKNANTMLAAQLLAAELNVAHLDHLGIDYCDCVGEVIDNADEFLSNHEYNGPDAAGEKPKGAAKQEANGYKDDLDKYNQGVCPC